MKTIALPLLASAVLLFSCNPAERPESSAAANLKLVAYDVPNDGAAQVRAVLKTLLWFGSDGKDSQKYVGRADIGPDGKLVVMAPESVQSGVKGLIDALAKNPPRPATRITMTYWMVFATPGKGAAPAANLGEVAAALAEIEKADGPQEFTLTEKITASALSGEEAYVEGHNAYVRQTASRTSKGVSAELSLKVRSQRLDTRLVLDSGQLLVLGSSGAAGAAKDGPPGSIYYLIRAASNDGRGE